LPNWKNEDEELELAKEWEAMLERGLEKLTKQRREEQEKMRLLQEVAELFKTDWPVQETERPTESNSVNSED
jgi:hypothetical protein